MKIQVTVCDIDQEVALPTKHYTIMEGERKVQLDLCSEHAGALEELLGRIPGPSPKEQQPSKNHRVPSAADAARARAPRMRGVKVKTLAEIEAEKKKG